MRRIALLVCLCLAPSVAACSDAASTSVSWDLDTLDGGPTAREAGIMRGDASLELHEAGHDATPSSPDAAPSPEPPSPDAAPPLAGDAMANTSCSLELAVGPLAVSSSTCHLDGDVTLAPATLTYPCGGGQATATFAGQSFVGTVENGHLSLSFTEPFTIGACTWRVTQSITGDLAAGTLDYAYSETRTAGTCTKICSATGAVQISRAL